MELKDPKKMRPRNEKHCMNKTLTENLALSCALDATTNAKNPRCSTCTEVQSPHCNSFADSFEARMTWGCSWLYGRCCYHTIPPPLNNP